MAWFLISGILLIIFVLVSFFSDDNVLDGLGRGMVCFLCAVILNFVCGKMIDYDADVPVERTELIETIQISAFKDTSYIYCSDKSTYKYIVSTDKGDTIKTLSATRVYFPKEYDGNPRIEKYACERTSSTRWWSVFPSSAQEYVVYIPEGSIMAEYEVDLE